MSDLPATMSGMVLTGHGGPEMLVWRDDLPVPRPGLGEVLVRLGAAAVNNTDINTRIGWYAKSVRGATDGASLDTDVPGDWSGALTFPRIQGADGCGVIADVGPQVDASRIGERVLMRAMFAPKGREGEIALETLGSERDGTFASFTVVPTRDAIAIDSPLTDVELATFPCAYSTAEGMIQRVGLGAERVLITGASGGVGSAAIQLARRRGAEVTAVTSPAKAAALRALGATETLSRDDPYPDRAFDVVVDLVGGPRFHDLLDALVPGGRYVASGAVAGPIAELDLRTLYLKDLTLHGSTYQPPNVFTDLVGYIEAGAVTPLLAETYPLRDLHAAQDAFTARAHVGKIGLTIATEGDG